MQRLLIMLLAAIAVLAAVRPLKAEDIDLFVQPAGSVPGLPNVLILLDNTANWNTPFTNEKAALVNTINGLPVNDDGSAKFRVGLMLFTETGSPNSNVDGGYVRVAIRDFDSATKAKFVNLVNSLDILLDKSNSGKAGKTFAEAYQYFSSLAPLTGSSKVKTDFPKPAGNPYRALNSAQTLALQDLPGNALPAFSGSPYASPLIDGSCSGNYIIYVSNGAVQDNSSDNTTATNWLTTAANAAGITGATTTIPISPSGSQSNVTDEWARFMRKSPRRIATYTVDVDKKSTGQGPGWTSLLKSTASVSDGKYFDVASGNGGAQITEALGAIFSEIQAVNSVFAAVSLPVSVNTEDTYLNQLYIGMFRPDKDSFPRWNGNLKQYKLGLVGNQLRTLDANDNQAISALTGFITECARSFWTPSTADSYWAFKPQGVCVVGSTNYENSNFPDGSIVEKGAQAYMLRQTTTRTVKTCLSAFGSCASAGALIDFVDSNVPKDTPGLGNAGMSDAQRTAYINWTRGQDLADENINGLTSTEMRPSVHGDIVHSRPIAINFGTDAAPKVVVFYAGNDGMLRAINGNRTAAIGSVAAGKEIWSFVPPEFFGHITRLRDNNVTISYKNTTITSPTPQPKPYGVDGNISVYDNDWLFAGMRRGGRALYAFDVGEIAAASPVLPSLLWKVGCPNLTDDVDCTPGFENLGQTWSAAKIIKTAGHENGSGEPKPMLIFGGGYDNCEDEDPVTDTCKSTGKGHRIYVVDAETGEKLGEFITERGVVSDLFIVPSEDGTVLWAYAADLGGNIYRLSGADANTPFADTAPEDWTLTKIASLGCATVSGCDTRKFMFNPDLVELDGTYYLMVGSGDREKPLDAWTSAYGATNYFFMVKDQPANATWLSSESGNCGSSVICLDSLLEIDEEDPDADELAQHKGWYLNLNPHEQVVTSAITVFGTTTFSTHTPVVPVSGQCTSNLGTARVYNIRFLDATARSGDDRSAEISGGGLPPSPVAGMVTLDDGTTVPFIIGADPDSPLEGSIPPSPASGTQPKSLTYWYIEK